MAGCTIGRERTRGCFPGFTRIRIQKTGEICYIGGTDVLPAPLSAEEETQMISRFTEKGDEDARNRLIEHNLRLVVYIAQKLTIPVWGQKI